MEYVRLTTGECCSCVSGLWAVASAAVYPTVFVGTGGPTQPSSQERGAGRPWRQEALETGRKEWEGALHKGDGVLCAKPKRLMGHLGAEHRET